jgi:hypothetical protein
MMNADKRLGPINVWRRDGWMMDGERTASGLCDEGWQSKSQPENDRAAIAIAIAIAPAKRKPKRCSDRLTQVSIGPRGRYLIEMCDSDSNQTTNPQLHHTLSFPTDTDPALSERDLPSPSESTFLPTSRRWPPSRPLPPPRRQQQQHQTKRPSPPSSGQHPPAPSS